MFLPFSADIWLEQNRPRWNSTASAVLLFVVSSLVLRSSSLGADLRAGRGALVLKEAASVSSDCIYFMFSVVRLIKRANAWSAIAL